MRFHDKMTNKKLESFYDNTFEYENNLEFLYNYIPDYIIMSIALTMQKKLTFISNEESENVVEELFEIWEQNNMQTLKYDLAKHFFLFGVVYLEAVLEENEYNEKTPKIYLHHPDSVEIVENDDGIEEVHITSDTKSKIITKDRIEIEIDGETEIKDNLYDGIPFVRIKNPYYKLLGLVKLQDTVNLYEDYLDAMFDIHADPMLFDDLGEAFKEKKANNKDTQINFSNDKRRYRKFFHYPKDSQGIKMLESNGAMTERIQNQQDKIINQIERKYPETVLMELLKSSGSITGQGMNKKLIQINATINLSRGILKNGLEELNEIIGWLVYNRKTQTEMVFESIFPVDLEETMENARKSVGLLSRNWLIQFMHENGVVADVEEEKANQEEEKNFLEPPIEW